MTDVTHKSILVVTDDLSSRNALPNIANSTRRVSEVASDVISDNLSRFLLSFEKLLEATDSVTSRLIVDQLELNVVVNAQGGIELVGKLNAGMTASIKITLKRRS